MTTFNVPWPVWTILDDESDAHLFKRLHEFVVPLFSSEEYAVSFISRGKLECVPHKFNRVSEMKSFLSNIPGYPSLDDPLAPVVIAVDHISPQESEGYFLPRLDVLDATSHWYDK